MSVFMLYINVFPCLASSVKQQIFFNTNQCQVWEDSSDWRHNETVDLLELTASLPLALTSQQKICAEFGWMYFKGNLEGFFWEAVVYSLWFCAGRWYQTTGSQLANALVFTLQRPSWVPVTHFWGCSFVGPKNRKCIQINTELTFVQLTFV